MMDILTDVVGELRKRLPAPVSQVKGARSPDLATFAPGKWL